MFTSGGLKEATEGYDMRRVTQALDVAGALVQKDGTGRSSVSTTAPSGDKVRLYYIGANVVREVAK